MGLLEPIGKPISPFSRAWPVAVVLGRSRLPASLTWTLYAGSGAQSVRYRTYSFGDAHINIEVERALPGSMAGLTKMLSGLRRQEIIFVGQTAMLPSRIIIRILADDQLPKSHDVDFDKGWQSKAMSDAEPKVVANRWRYQK